jgi:signal transduction histidine kinase
VSGTMCYLCLSRSFKELQVLASFYQPDVQPEFDSGPRSGCASSPAQANVELAYVARNASLDELTVPIAHEINQPLGVIVNSASASMRWLAVDPHLRQAQQIQKIDCNSSKIGS